ncbi:biotin/lipoyl-containing protein [Piscinibacter sakaiensis]|uniref:acetyl-CoA carboxylase biotin carboxyl carrier protein subunit n=1 Tax=Piscinibacter sakaiensis TaxID=1547922 RepID=UPI003AAA4901
MHARYLIDGAIHDVVATRDVDGGVRLRRGEHVLAVGREALPDGRWRLRVGERTHVVHIAIGADAVFVHADGIGAVEVERQQSTHATGAAAGGGSDVLVAPMPGVVIAVLAGTGDVVHAGQALMVIESMKLETTLLAPHNARIKAVHFPVGASFALKAALITLEGV